jgi:hypothetical protein
LEGLYGCSIGGASNGLLNVKIQFGIVIAVRRMIEGGSGSEFLLNRMTISRIWVTVGPGSNWWWNYVVSNDVGKGNALDAEHTMEVIME